jgi:hypothetical protein
LPVHRIRLSARTFAAALVAFRTPISGIDVSFRKPDGTSIPDQQLLALAATIQARIWVSIVQAWMNEMDHRATLEEDLGFHFSEGVVVTGADTQALAALDEIEMRESSPIRDRYCLEATYASVCAVAKKRNARVEAWVSVFFQVELESRSADTRLVTERQPLLVSDDAGGSTNTKSPLAGGFQTAQ